MLQSCLTSHKIHLSKASAKSNRMSTKDNRAKLEQEQAISDFSRAHLTIQVVM